MTAITLRLDDNLKTGLEQMCNEMGMNLTTFFTIYAKKAYKEKRIPFEITADSDPFYSESNLYALKVADKQIKQGKTITKTMDELEAMEK